MIKSYVHMLLCMLLPGLVSATLSAQGLKEIHIDCDPDEFAHIYENYEEDIYIPVTISHAGTTWTDVLMRLRGDSSREYPKKSLKVQFGSEPFVNGKFTVNFNAEYHDLSYMHSVLSSLLFSQAGIPSPDMEHVRVYLNGVFFGLYVMTENMDEQFIEDHDLDPEGILYKASRDGACLSIYDNVFYHWDLNAGSDPYRDQLTTLIRDLNDPDINFLELMQSDFKFSKVLDFMAMNMLLSNGSTYYHNYFLYYDNSSACWFLLPWDLDRTFSDYSMWYPYHRSSGLWTPDNPLLERSILDEEVLQHLKGSLVTLEGSLFNAEMLFPVLDSLQGIIAASVAEDETDNIPDIETWLNKIDQDKEFIQGRYQLLISQFTHHPSSFEVDRKTSYFQPGEELEFTWQESVDPDGDVLTYTFHFGPDPFFEDPSAIEIAGIESTELLFQLPETAGKYFWMVESTDGTHMVEGFDTRNVLFVDDHIPMLVINEINYNSSPDFDPGDWVEIHNPEIDPVDMSGWQFKDEDDDHVFSFPQGTVIDPKAYLVLCRDTAQFRLLFTDPFFSLGDLGFGFDAGGEWLRLFSPEGYLVDEVHYRDEAPWPEEPDGEGATLELLNPSLDNTSWYNWVGSDDHGTPGSQNGKYSPEWIDEYAQGADPAIRVWPNPCRDRITIAREDQLQSPADVSLYDLEGRLILTRVFGRGSSYILHTDELSQGIFIGMIRFGKGERARFLIIKE